MGLFGKAIMCSSCGEKTNIITRKDFKDGTSICGKCASIIPNWISEHAIKEWQIQSYQEFKNYLQYSETSLRPIFQETHHYNQLLLDVDHGIFCIVDNFFRSISKETIFLEFKNLYNYNFEFLPEEFQSGILSDKVKGKISFGFVTHTPFLAGEFLLDSEAKAKAKTNLLHTKVSYETPKTLAEFESAFTMGYYMHAPETNQESQMGTEAVRGELQNALTLFMFDSLDGVSLEDLKAQRNRLIKAFHTDNDQSASSQFSAKINTAYDLLKKELESG